MKRILVPIDFSDCSKEAAKYAIAIAKSIKDVQLYFFNAVPTKEYAAYIGQEIENINEITANKIKIEEDFDLFLNGLDHEDLSINRHYDGGNVVWKILEFAESKSIDLIVMGTHGRNGLDEWAVGSTAQKVVRRAECPVLTVKYCPEEVQFNNIVFVSDFEEQVSDAFGKCCAFADLFKSKIHLLNIDTPNYFTEIPFLIKASMEDFQEMYEGPTEIHRIYSWNVERGIEKFLAHTQADLVVMATHGGSGLQRFFLNSIAEGVVNHLNFPVMTIKMADPE